MSVGTGTRYRARCRCGWTSGWLKDYTTAQTRRVAHRDQVVSEARLIGPVRMQVVSERHEIEIERGGEQA
jgi:hypothetical protein